MTFNVISLGAGVQSSTMALMASAGEIKPMPDAAVFSDTKAEPSVVYSWLDWLETQLPFPVYRVTAGNLGEDFLKALQDPKLRCGQPPFFVRHENMSAMLWRKCTKEYKIVPIRRKIRELRNGARVSQWIGISLDEAHRMRPSNVGYIENRYPLVDMRVNRQDCIRWMERHGYPRPPKSACFFCPYTSNDRLREMRDKYPDDWVKLVQFDASMRHVQSGMINGARFTGVLYTHRDCKPVGEVDLSVAADYGQADMFGNECEGMCGV